MADDHVELGPAVNDSEDAFAYCLALLGIGVVFRLAEPSYGVLDWVVKEAGCPVELD